jgi:hypothetical protein
MLQELLINIHGILLSNEAGTASLLEHLGSSPVEVLYEDGTASLLKYLGSSPVDVLYEAGTASL